MDITTTAGWGAGQAVVTVAGELDIHTAPDVRQALAAAVAVYEETVLDLAHLGFCDCAGLGALIAARNAARRHGTRLHLYNIPGHLQRLARATGTSLAAASDTPGRPSGPTSMSPRRAGMRPVHGAVG
ncbi:STAS domain-containing protein [Streptomyces sp. NPDC002659]|uniref:STAS domain-containing protein n=1 Tax=Streptomyces sp. NPDC002659 TaxID=3364656 RepID=UPI0036787555